MWIPTYKGDESRLVVKGFSQAEGVEENESTSPTPAVVPLNMEAAVANENA